MLRMAHCSVVKINSGIFAQGPNICGDFRVTSYQPPYLICEPLLTWQADRPATHYHTALHNKVAIQV